MALKRVSNRRKGKKISRAEKAEMVRIALFDAAAHVVGKYGYAGASVSRITTRAGVAQGTFYNYFDSRQDLLDQLLPVLGQRMLAFIAKSVGDCANEREREERRFRAFFEYLMEAPEFYRILNEAELFAPKGHRAHIENIAKNYKRALERAVGRGEMPGYQVDELETLVFILMAARSYLSMRYSYWDGKKVRPVPESMIKTYAKFVADGLFGPAPSEQQSDERLRVIA